MEETAYASINELISKGYKCLEAHDSTGASDIWLNAWNEIHKLLDTEGNAGIDELQKKYDWDQYISNWVQDLDTELHNAGLDDPEYFKKRIQYCEEMLEVYPEEKADTLLILNTRQSIAESYYELGDTDHCDNLFEKIMGNDPEWGWGWIGWSACYWRDCHNKNIEKGQSILERGLAVGSVRDFDDLLDYASELYTETNQHEKASRVEAELKELKKKQHVSSRQTGGNQPVHVEKIGRNESCPCGSGKKYKKCCGR